MSSVTPSSRPQAARISGRRRGCNRGTALALLAVCALGCASAPAWLGGAPRAKNAILFVGDGMGISTLTAARIFEGQQRGEPGEENQLSFERFPYTALVKTYNTDAQVPDSAGTMTAIVTGTKTRAGLISVGPAVRRGDAATARDHVLPTLFERAEQLGLSTGIVTTTRLTHATPAACYAHSPNRGWEHDGALPESARQLGFPDIARQLIEFPHGDGPEIALGGGRERFWPNSEADPEEPGSRGERRDGRNLTREWIARREGGVFVWKRDQLVALDPKQRPRVLGLFERSHMHFEHDRASDAAGEPSLSEMTAFAIDALAARGTGYLLMVEGGRIDHAHHGNNAYRALSETVELSNAVRVAAERTSEGDTLIVVTADHSHTLTLAGKPARGNPILGWVATIGENGERLPNPERDESGLTYTTLQYANGGKNLGAGRRARDGVDPTRPDYHQEFLVPFDQETHAGEDVAVFARGPGAERFHGLHEQSWIHDAIEAALGWERLPGSR
jgi:alkaline phosphatase